LAGDFRAQVEALRPYLIRYASLELRNREAAEDAVSASG
jgi:DNA-directed RNA polymerase specialized sigma24 family protein